MGGLKDMFSPPKIALPKPKDEVSKPDPNEERVIERRRNRAAEDRLAEGRASTRLTDRGPASVDYSGSVLGD